MVLPVPALGYSPESNFYFGAVCLFTVDLYQDTLTRSSTAKVEFNYTLRKQLVSEISWNYFFKNENWRTRGDLHYSRFIDQYYGIGAETPDDNELIYESNRLTMEVDILKKIKSKLFIGLGTRFLDYSRFQTFDKDNPFEELSPDQVYGLKAIAINDTRDHILTPCKGRFQELSISYNRSNDEGFVRFTLDIREYAGNNGNRFAFRLYNSLNFGNPPFFDLSMIGGDQFARGYYFGRYRNNHLSSLQMEYRSPFFWRLSGALFGGVSSVYSNFEKIRLDRFKPNAGIGLRFLMDKKENTSLRLDYALGVDGQSGFYVSFGESF